ncbi:hypothetical protein F511_02833 [Dorcoceras hygrometricum]|uniref:Uncharacterized protein n=1 Tax=Dorcoceras hygrometricum TaxID=472368 RepID=A0A2Z7BIG2_9LAMI|nr:hypothetical protein F511_02833 [Dorcoceras hygrometricum]
MLSKTLICPLLLAMTLQSLSMQTTSLAIEAGRKPVLVHITNTVPAEDLSQVNMTIRVVGGDFLPSVALSRGQEYQMEAIENNPYIAMAYFGLEFAAFDPYLPGRDKGQAAVYWKVNDVGFYISYDGSKWKLDTPWETE